MLSRGDRLTAKERAAAVRKLASLTGLSEDYVDRADLRIEHWRFFGELLRDERRTVGRLDGRFTGRGRSRDRRGDGRRPVASTRSPARTPPRSTTTCATSSATRTTCPTSRSPGACNPWSFKDFEGRPIDVAPKLERAMRANPHLQVHVAYGYYDGATPHFAAEDVVAHLQTCPTSCARTSSTSTTRPGT